MNMETPKELVCKAGNSTNNFEKKPAKGGIPAIENRSIVREAANEGLNFAKDVRSDK